MLVIRLARTGRSKYPTYRIVAAESSRPATGRFVEILGHYNPHTKELVIKHEETEKRLSQGAQPSNTVVKLLTRDKVVLPAWVKLKTKAPKAVAATEESVEVTETEAAADAEGTEDAPEASDAEALTDETRVASTTEEAAAEAGDDVPNINATETAATDEAATADAEAATDAADEATETKSDK